MGTVVTIAESRRAEAPALRVLLLSLQRYAPRATVRLVYSAADASFRKWLHQLDNVTLIDEQFPEDARGINVKPWALLSALAAGEEVWWIDTDVVVANRVETLSEQLTDETLVLSEEALYSASDDAGRAARGWDRRVTRTLPRALNTGVLRVTRQHESLLDAWGSMLRDPTYLKASQMPYADRPYHLRDDQLPLTALLTSEPHSSIPTKWLRRGVDIVQFFGPPGYTPRERLCAVRTGPPIFIHAQGHPKPWHVDRTEGGLRSRFERVYGCELSPYRLAAQRLVDELEPGLAQSDEFDWLREESRIGAIARSLAKGDPALSGLPLAVAIEAARALKRVAHPLRARAARDGRLR